MRKRSFVVIAVILAVSTVLLFLLAYMPNTAPSISSSAQAAVADGITPTVTAIDPRFAPNDLDALVIITGTHFTAELSGTLVLTSPTAYLGSVALTHVTWVTSATLTATVPWGLDPGVYTLTVVNPDGGAGSFTNAFTVTQGIGQWNGGNLFGGLVVQLLLKPGDPNTVYALTYEVGLFRSRDAGDTWRFIGGGWAVFGGIVADPHRPSRLYAGSSRSENEGDTWTVMLNQWPDGRALNGAHVYPSPHNAQLLFLSSVIDTDGTPSALGLLKSTDDGASWAIISDMEGISVRTLAFHPYNPQEMVLGTSDGRVFQSIDGGTHWNSVTKPPIDDIGVITYNLFVASGEVWAAGFWATGAAGIVKSVDSTFTTWVDVAPDNVQVDSIDFASATSVYLALHWVGGYHSSDDGGSWQPIGASTGGYDIAFTPNNPNVMYMGDYQYGVQKTTDGGQTWEVKNQGISAMIASSIVAPPGDIRRVYAVFAGWQGVFRSNDSAANWQFIPVENAVGIRQVRVDPFDSQRVYLAADSGFYTSLDGGMTWTPGDGSHVYGGMPYAFQIDPHRPGHFLVGVLVPVVASGALYVSTDFGQTWEPVTVTQDLSAVQDIAFDPLHPGGVYIATTGGAYRSQNDGSTWERIPSENGQELQITFSIAIATHPQPMVVVGGWGSRGSISYRSLDGGDTWAEVGCPAAGILDRILFVDGDSSRFYEATMEGLLLSVDGAQTCTRASGALGRLIVKALAYASSGNQTILYAATTGGDLGAPSSMTVDASLKSTAAENNLVEAGIYRYVQRTWQTFLPVVKGGQ